MCGLFEALSGLFPALWVTWQIIFSLVSSAAQTLCRALVGPSDTPTCPILSAVTYDLRLSALCLPSPWPHGEAGTLGPGEGALGLLGDTFVSHIHSCV